MLRNRSRGAVTGKQALMADHHSSQSFSYSQNYAKPVSSFFGSPRFRAFAAMGLSETDHSVVSPTSVLDSKPFSPLGNPFSHDRKQPKSPKLIFSENKQQISEPKAIGLALIEDNHNNDSKPNKTKVLFSANLRVQIPPPPPQGPQISSTDSPKSPVEFRTKPGNPTQTKSPNIISVVISESEMKLSEEYTCVRTHGPNPKTTHIFDNCVVKSFKSKSTSASNSKNHFLSFCHTCKINLQQTNDIYIYRGEKAFCSHECRYQEMLLDEIDDS